MTITRGHRQHGIAGPLLAAATAGLAAVTLLSGCAAKTTSNNAVSTITTVTPTASTPASTAPPTTTPPTTPAPVNTSTAGYTSARKEWVKGATAISAQEGLYWQKAADDLTSGKSTDGSTTGYTTAISELTNLIALPDAQQTTVQNAEYHAYIAALNAFFKTPGLYS